MKYFEIEFSNDYRDECICIKGNREPTIEEAQKFCQKDSEMLKMPVTNVYPIGESVARDCYDFSNELNWPVFE